MCRIFWHSVQIRSSKGRVKDGATNYTSNVPENALVGMNVLNTDKVFWYDEENSNKILASTDPLLLDKETGDMKTMSVEVVAKAM